MLNDALPRIEVNPDTYEVRADGELLQCDAVDGCRWRSGIFVLIAKVSDDGVGRTYRVSATGGPIFALHDVKGKRVKDTAGADRIYLQSELPQSCAEYHETPSPSDGKSD